MTRSSTQSLRERSTETQEDAFLACNAELESSHQSSKDSDHDDYAVWDESAAFSVDDLLLSTMEPLLLNI